MAITRDERGRITLDVELPERLTEFLAEPRCADIALPEPASVSLALPTGGRLRGVADVTRAIPTDCALNVSLMLQLGPILANLECFIRVLKLLKPLMDVIDGLPVPPVKAIQEFGEAAAEVTECVVAFTSPAGMLPFVRDILCLIARMFRCLVDQTKNLLAVMRSLELQATAAQGNDALLANLDCARENVQRSANSVLQSVEPAMVILEWVAPLLEIAQMPAIEVPSFGDVEGIDEMEQYLATMEGFVETLELAAEAAGGCD